MLSSNSLYWSSTACLRTLPLVAVRGRVPRSTTTICSVVICSWMKRREWNCLIRLTISSLSSSESIVHFSEASTNKAGEGRPLPTTTHSKTSSPQVARTLSSIDLNWSMISVFGRCAPGCGDLPGVTPETTLDLDPITPSTPRKILSRFNLEEEIAGVEVTVCAPERDIRTITRVGQDHELQELAG